MIYIGLGSNLGNKAENLSTAKKIIVSGNNINIIMESSILETEPVDYLDQPSFLNQIIAIETSLKPRDLLIALQSVERTMGKKIIIPKGPRIIDLDILLYHDHIHSDDDLSVPHKGIMKRDFILKHLVELDSTLRDPVSGILYKEVLYGNNKEYK